MKRTRMRPVSNARAREKRARANLVADLAAQGVRCEIGPYLPDPDFCIGRLGGLHERRKRSSRGSLVAGLNLIPACNPCNGWVEDRLPILAADSPDVWGPWLRWLVVRPGDPHWEACGLDSMPPLEVSLCSTCGAPYVQLGPPRTNPVAPCGHPVP